mmetsp:Transcript_62429/g.123371  ORF Transcript_62429/g.123371 Transcript_62429/m.123371 type:complete len:109 (-) Transcript_62429:53-379(-)
MHSKCTLIHAPLMYSYAIYMYSSMICLCACTAKYMLSSLRRTRGLGAPPLIRWECVCLYMCICVSTCCAKRAIQEFVEANDELCDERLEWLQALSEPASSQWGCVSAA